MQKRIASATEHTPFLPPARILLEAVCDWLPFDEAVDLGAEFTVLTRGVLRTLAVRRATSAQLLFVDGLLTITKVCSYQLDSMSFLELALSQCARNEH
jgi:hypothetical protein